MPFKTSAVFCKVCGMMLRIESANAKNECRFCHNVTDMNEMMKQGDLMTETKVTLSQRKEWLREVVKTENNERPTVEQDCPKCGNNFTYYTTRQTRSADEGQTVYYECTKCAHTFTENT